MFTTCTCNIQNKWILFNRLEKKKCYVNNGVSPIGSLYVWDGVVVYRAIIQVDVVMEQYY